MTDNNWNNIHINKIVAEDSCSVSYIKPDSHHTDYKRIEEKFNSPIVVTTTVDFSKCTEIYGCSIVFSDISQINDMLTLYDESDNPIKLNITESQVYIALSTLENQYEAVTLCEFANYEIQIKPSRRKEFLYELLVQGVIR